MSQKTHPGIVGAMGRITEAGSHLEGASLDKLEGQDGSALLHQAVAVGRHGARCDAAHISVMAPRCHKEYELALTEHWGDDCDVWQM